MMMMDREQEADEKDGEGYRQEKTIRKGRYKVLARHKAEPKLYATKVDNTPETSTPGPPPQRMLGPG
jgi:hypothetical protein